MYVALSSEKRSAYELSVERSGGKRLHERRGLKLGQILKWILKREDGGGGCGLDSFGLR
jgi:hypothetical protein